METVLHKASITLSLIIFPNNILVVHHLITLPFWMASASFIFHCSATSFARGSSGFGALSNAWIDSSTVRICNAGLHLSAEKVKHFQYQTKPNYIIIVHFFLCYFTKRKRRVEGIFFPKQLTLDSESMFLLGIYLPNPSITGRMLNKVNC